MSAVFEEVGGHHSLGRKQIECQLKKDKTASRREKFSLRDVLRKKDEVFGNLRQYISEGENPGLRQLRQRTEKA